MRRLSLLLLGGVLAFCSIVSVTSSSWPRASLAHAANTTATGSLAFTHTYPAGPTCAAAPGTGSLACPGTLVSGQAATASDAITNKGTVASSALTQSVAVTSCEPVSFANTANTVNPLVDRYGTTFDQAGPFAGAGSVAFDGSTGYATSVAAQMQPPGFAQPVGIYSAIGIWFKATSGTNGPLYSFGATATNGTGHVDRTLFLDSAGQLTFVWNSNGSAIGPTTTSGGYANGAWHFAYVTVGWIQPAGLEISPQITLYVDGTQVATTPAVALGIYTGFSGYWHLGFASTSTTGLSTSYFGGSLSNFVVFDGTTIPAPPPITNPSSVSAFASFASGATEWWPLNDSGTTTFVGTLPVVGAGSGNTASAACKSFDLGWSFTAPNGAATSSDTSLYSWVATPGVVSAVGTPSPGTTQSATLTVSHDAGYNSYVAGLHLWVPMTSTISATSALQWSVTFGWMPSATSTIIAAP